MKCAKVIALLPLHVGGDLDEDLAADLDRHVRACDACAQELRACEASRQTLFALKGEAAPPAPDLWPVVRLRVGPPPRVRRWRPLRVAAALLLAAMGTYAVASLRSGTVPPEATPDPKVAEAESPQAPRAAQYVLAEVGPSSESPGDVQDAGELPFVVPAGPERTGWDEF